MSKLAKTTAIFLATASILSAMTSAAKASIGIECLALDGSKAEIFIALSGGVGFGVLSAMATDGKNLQYQTEEREKKQGTTLFQKAQGMVLGEQLYADFSDMNAEKIIVSLRVHVDLVNSFTYPKSEEDDLPGSLKFLGQKAIPVSCTYG